MIKTVKIKDCNGIVHRVPVIDAFFKYFKTGDAPNDDQLQPGAVAGGSTVKDNMISQAGSVSSSLSYMSFYRSSGTQLPSASGAPSQHELHKDVTIKKIYVRVSFNNRDSSATLKLLNDTVDTGASITVPAGTTGVFDSGDINVSFTKGDYLTLEADATAGTTGSITFYPVYEYE